MDQNSKYEKWKADYAIQQKKDKKESLVIRTFIVLGIASVFMTLYLWRIDELKFFWQPTKTTKAVVLGTGHSRVAPRGNMFIQKACYQYEVDGKTYVHCFHPSKSLGELFFGDSLEVKYSTVFPQNSKALNIIYRIPLQKSAGL